VTPPDIAARLVDYAGNLEGLRILEPSAGTGALVRAFEARGVHSADVVTIERERALCDVLERMGAHPVCADFEEWATTTEERFDLVVMNPPFRRARQHVEAAFNLLVDGGSLLAIVPSTFDGEPLEDLPAGAFALTGARAKIIERIKGYTREAAMKVTKFWEPETVTLKRCADGTSRWHMSTRDGDEVVGDEDGAVLKIHRNTVALGTVVTLTEPMPDKI